MTADDKTLLTSLLREHLKHLLHSPALISDASFTEAVKAAPASLKQELKVLTSLYRRLTEPEQGTLSLSFDEIAYLHKSLLIAIKSFEDSLLVSDTTPHQRARLFQEKSIYLEDFQCRALRKQVLASS